MKQGLIAGPAHLSRADRLGRGEPVQRETAADTCRGGSVSTQWVTRCRSGQAASALAPSY